MDKKKAILSILAVALIFAAAAKFSAKKPTVTEEKPLPPQSVSVRSASDSKFLTKETDYPATVVGDQEVDVTAKSAGTVSAATYGIGDKINIGALLARIDDTGNTLQTTDKGFRSAQVQQSQLSKEQAQESLEIAEKSYKNLKKAYDAQQKDSTLTKTVSKAQVDSAKGQIDIAEIQLDSAKVGFKSTLDNHLITSPISGVVTQKAVSAGDSVSVGQLIATISKSSNVKIQFFVDQDQRNAVARGQEISAIDANGNPSALKITNIAAAADPDTKRFLIEAIPSDSSHAPLLSGTILTVKVRNNLQPQNKNNLILPLSAINVGQNESYVFIAEKDAAKKIVVKVVNVNGETAEISTDIPSETLIITEGSKLVHDGETITINK